LQQQIIDNLNNVRKFNIIKSNSGRFARIITINKQQLPAVLPLIILSQSNVDHIIVPVRTSIHSAAFHNPVRTPVHALQVTYPYNIINDIQLVDILFFNWRQDADNKLESVCIWCYFKCSNYICALCFEITFDKYLRIDTFYWLFTFIHMLDPNFGYRNKNTMEIIDNDTWN
jgi:hypothetical protein